MDSHPFYTDVQEQGKVMSRLQEMTKREKKRHILWAVSSLLPLALFGCMWLYMFTPNEFEFWATLVLAIAGTAWILKRLFFPTDTEELPKRALERPDGSKLMR